MAVGDMVTELNGYIDHNPDLNTYRNRVIGELSAAQRQKSANRLMRAPLVLLVVARITAHAKVPEIEQIMSTAAAVQNMLSAAHALGVGAMWRSGLVTYEPLLAKSLGLAENERLLGFLYLGTPSGTVKQIPALDIDQFFSAWKPR